MVEDFLNDFPRAKPSGEEAFELLKRGNHRFFTKRMHHPHQDAARFKEARFADPKDHAFACVVGCSDSRVAPEIIFDRGLMDLFVVRTAGNVVGQHEVASIEYALEYLEIRLLVILGHSHCGAVQTAINLAENPSLKLSPNIKDLARKILPKDSKRSPPYSLSDLVEENVLRSFQSLLNASPTAKALINQGVVLPKLGVSNINRGYVQWIDDAKF